MALAAFGPREPEVARFIDTYKFDQDMAVKRDRFGGGTSLPLNSDGYEDKQQALRDERHKDWLYQQDKPKDPVYYRVGTPEQGFPGLGEYEKHRHEKNLVRQKEYNDMIQKQRQAEQQKLEARRHAPPPRPAQPPGPQMDYNLAGEQAKAEERRAYQDYMGKYQPEHIAYKPPIDYDESRKLLQAERKQEYNHLIEEKAKEERYWAMRGRPVTPPGGLNIGNYDRQVKEQAQAKKEEYKKMLDEQQREHMFLRARQEPEMAVLDRHGQPPQYLANKPPPGPGYSRGRDEAEKRRQDEDMFRQQQQQSKPAEVVKNPFYSSDDYEKFQKELNRKQGEEYREFLSQGYQPPPGRIGLPLGQYKYEPKRLLMEAERNYEWNKVSKEQLSDRRPKDDDGRPQGLNIDVSYHHEKQAWLERQRNKEYNEHLRKRSLRDKAPTPPNLSGLPIGQYNYEHMYKAMEHERNREYNAFLQKKYGGEKTFRSSRSEPARTDNPKTSFYYGNEMEHREKQKMLDAERRNEYNQFMKEQNPPRSKSIDVPSDVDSGLPIGQQHHEAWRKFLSNQRNQEYNQLVDRQKMTNPGRRHDFVDTASGPYGGLFHGLGEHGNRSDDLNKERQKEYNERLDQKYAGKDRPSGRPKWVQDSLPNNTDRGRSPMKTQPPADQYQQMLNEKRREEANLRRFEDPEYQDRLSRGRDRGADGPRDMDVEPHKRQHWY